MNDYTIVINVMNEKKNTVMTLLEAVIAYAGSLAEEPEDLLTDATPEQLNLPFETSDLFDIYTHFWGRRYVFTPAFFDGKNYIIHMLRNPGPETPYASNGPLLTRLVEL